MNRRQITAAAWGAAIALLLAQSPCGAERSGTKSTALEDKVKTAFLYKFTNYIRWPQSPPEEEFRIAVLGDSGILPHLRELARQKTAGGRKIKVELLRSADEIGPCRILFIAATEKERLREILKKIEGRNILTVGDSAGLALRGVAVNFLIVEGRVRFEINRGAAARAGLEISSELLKLAILVEEAAGAKNVQP